MEPLTGGRYVQREEGRVKMSEGQCLTVLMYLFETYSEQDLEGRTRA